jgi:hypothetical protein
MNARVGHDDFHPVGPIKVWFDYPSMPELVKLYPYLTPGGHSQPKTCVSRNRVAIIIPYR